MPVTPLHIGLPGLFSFRWPQRVDVFTAVLGSVLIDLEFFVYLIYGTPIHGQIHTFAGATLMALAIIGIALLCKGPITKVKEWFQWETKSDLRSMTLGAFIGTFSHILYDSLIYVEMNPFHPREGNPLYHQGGQGLIFPLVYAIAGFTTILLMVLYIIRYERLQRSEDEGKEGIEGKAEDERYEKEAKASEEV